MSEGIESLWKEYESLATATESGARSTLAPWITREQVTVQWQWSEKYLAGNDEIISGILCLVRPVQPACQDDSWPGPNGHLFHAHRCPLAHLLQEAQRHPGQNQDEDR